jgi:hypothetical protein
MPLYTIKFGHYLILEATVAVEAPDRTKARGIAENIRDRGSLGVIAWEVKDSAVPGWKVVSRNAEVETVQEE